MDVCRAPGTLDYATTARTHDSGWFMPLPLTYRTWTLPATTRSQLDHHAPSNTRNDAAYRRLWTAGSAATLARMML